MRLSKIGYYADLVVYPILLFALTVSELRTADARSLVIWFLACLLGLVGYTFIEYIVHRFLLHSMKLASRAHEMHHSHPTAFIGTPTWLSALVFACGATPLLWIVGVNITEGAVAGLIIGYIWYLVVHDAVHRRRLGRESILYKAKMRHIAHHYSTQEGNFGVSTALWDRVFGTVLVSAGSRQTCTGPELN